MITPGWANCGGFFDLPKLQTQLSELETRMASADFWSNRERAQGVVEEVSRLRNLITPMRELEREVQDSLVDMANSDPLTGLANRRGLAQRAAEI